MLPRACVSFPDYVPHGAGPLSGGKTRYLIDSYLDWTAREPLPAVEGLGVDLEEVATAPWPRLGGGCRAAFVHLRGRGDFLGLLLIEIPPVAQTDWVRHLYDEVFYVLTGQGGASIELSADEPRTFSWGPRALFAPPLNARFRLTNPGNAPARLLCANDLPFLMNVFRNEHFLFDHPADFRRRPVRPAGEGALVPIAPGRHLWQTGFVPDLGTLPLPEWDARGPALRNINIALSDSSMHAHVSELPAGTYSKGRRHDTGVHVIGISGVGYTLVWKEGEGAFERLELRPGSLFALPDETLHQHFNPGTEPVRYLAVSIGNECYPVLARKLNRRAVFDSSVKDGGLQIEYSDQDRRIHGIWRDAIAATGAVSRMEEIVGGRA
jgi:mannose-6-phosphate isomerase-like protein (cupin superfamily)